jgi:hypothetical protein
VLKLLSSSWLKLLPSKLSLAVVPPVSVFKHNVQRWQMEAKAAAQLLAQVVAKRAFTYIILHISLLLFSISC